MISGRRLENGRYLEMVNESVEDARDEMSNCEAAEKCVLPNSAVSISSSQDVGEDGVEFIGDISDTVLNVLDE